MFRFQKNIKYFNLTRYTGHANIFCMKDFSEFDVAIYDFKLSLRDFTFRNRLKKFKTPSKYLHDKYLEDKKSLNTVFNLFKKKDFDKTYVAIHGLKNQLRTLVPEKVWYVVLKNLTKI